MKRLLALAIMILACMNVLSFVYITQVTSQLDELKVSVLNNTGKVIVYKSEDGYTPVKGVDYFDGTNAVSFSVQNYVLREVTKEVSIPAKDGLTPACYFEVDQCKGPQGNTGQNGESGDEVRINDETGDLEKRKIGERYWETMLPCIKLQVGCVAGSGE